MKKTTVLRKAILERRAVVVPGCHDAFRAPKSSNTCGFEAIADLRLRRGRRRSWANPTSGWSR